MIEFIKENDFHQTEKEKINNFLSKQNINNSSISNCEKKFHYSNTSDINFSDNINFSPIPNSLSSIFSEETICGDNFECKSLDSCQMFLEKTRSKDENESQLISPNIDSQIISNDCIYKTEAYLVQICCININYSTYKPPPSSSKDENASNHCCLLCSSSRYYNLAQFFIDHKLDDLQPFISGLPIDSRSHESQFILKIQSSLPFEFQNILITLQQRMHLREIELIQGVIYFEQILKSHWLCSTFVLFRRSLPMLLLACFLVSHKLSSDIQRGNNKSWVEAVWGEENDLNENLNSIDDGKNLNNNKFKEIFGDVKQPRLLSLDSFEVAVMVMLDYKLLIDKKSLKKMRDILC